MTEDTWTRGENRDWWGFRTPSVKVHLWNLLTTPMTSTEIRLRLNTLHHNLDYFTTFDLLAQCEREGIIRKVTE